MSPSLLRQILAIAEAMGGDEVFDPGISLRYMSALHGLLIVMGEVHHEAALSGQQVLERAEEIVADYMQKNGLQAERVEDD